MVRYFLLVCALIAPFYASTVEQNDQVNPIDARVSSLVRHVKKSIKKAEKQQSGLTPEVLALNGMSSPKVRHLLNNLCTYPHTRYLEIGVWKGSTWISALYNNKSTVEDAVAIDNWSKFQGPKEEFARNCAKFLPKNVYRFYSEDSFKLNLVKSFSLPINIYFYDGDHSALSQERALTYYNSVLDDVFVVLVDDWNRVEVKQGTFAALKKLGHEVIFQRELPAFREGDSDNWWNGIYIAVIRKKN
jgi:hypothetical protein